MMKVYLQIYLPNAHRSPPFTIIHNISAEQTIQQLIDIIPGLFKEVNPSYYRIYQNPNGKDLRIHQNRYISSFFNENDDIFIYFDLPRPVKIVEQDQLQNPQIKYKTLTKYTFYEYDETSVRVVLDLPGVGKVGQDNINLRVMERGFEIKIHNYNKDNFAFGVPKTQNKIKVETSKFMLKPDKIIIILKKYNKQDNWFALHKTKTIGGDDD